MLWILLPAVSVLPCMRPYMLPIGSSLMVSPASSISFLTYLHMLQVLKYDYTPIAICNPSLTWFLTLCNASPVRNDGSMQCNGFISERQRGTRVSLASLHVIWGEDEPGDCREGIICKRCQVQ